MQIACLPPDHPLAQQLLPLATAAAAKLELGRYLSSLSLCLDDISADERVWLSFGPPVAGVGGKAEDLTDRRSLTIYLHPDHLLKDRVLGGGLVPEAAVWQMGGSQAAARQAAAEQEISRPKIERFLYHQFMLVRDLCDGSLVCDQIPAEWADAFQEAWAVTIDGRLRRQYLPGYSAAERRRRFSRFFAASGVILPDHWRIFHRLWEDPELDQDRLLVLLQHLPRRRSVRN
jgi:hypothetical protein